MFIILISPFHTIILIVSCKIENVMANALIIIIHFDVPELTGLFNSIP